MRCFVETASALTSPLFTGPIRSGRIAEVHLDGLREHGLQRLLAATKRHMDHVEVLQPPEPRRRQMVVGRRSAARIGDLARVGAGIVDELAQRRIRRILRGDEDHSVGARDADRHQILERLVVDPLGERQHGEERAADEQDGVAVGGRMQCVVDADGAASSGLVLDVECLPEHLAEAVGGEARHGVGDAARRVGHHHLHGAGRPGLRHGRRRRTRRISCTPRLRPSIVAAALPRSPLGTEPLWSTADLYHPCIGSQQYSMTARTTQAILPVRLPRLGATLARGIRAGRWVFVTGLNGAVPGQGCRKA